MSWYVASTVNNMRDDHYIFINNSSVSNPYTLTQDDIEGYQFIDYIVVGGGGGGGGGADGEGVSNYGGGGGGSGYLNSSFEFQGINNGFNYNIPVINGSSSISLSFATSIIIQLGEGGAPGSGCNLDNPGNCQGGNNGLSTTLTVNYTGGQLPIIKAGSGGSGGGGGGYTCGGQGGYGYNGGGGGGGGNCGGNGGNGDTLNSGSNGGSGGSDNGGNGGGLGGGEGGQGSSEQDGDNTGGGGGGGTGITNIGTGGQGAESFREDPNRPATSGLLYTGGGGGGGTSNVGSGYEEPGYGGSGYAIIWLHN